MRNLTLTILMILIMPQIVNAVTVGAVNDGECDYNSIQAAIDGEAEFTVIRVASGFSVNNRIEYNENLFINKSHTFFGGYADCFTANANILVENPPKVNLKGTGNGAVIAINDTNAVFISKFEISGGNSAIGGGITFTNTLLQLIDSIVHHNTSTTFGGGIYSIHHETSSNATQLSLFNTLVIDNTATDGGGGIYCKSGRILADINSGVSANQATSTNADGGGLYLESCDMDFSGGTIKTFNTMDLTSYKGISNNSASRHGGGIYAISSLLKLFGSSEDIDPQSMSSFIGSPVSITRNTADSNRNDIGNGGGVYVIGQIFFTTVLEVRLGKVQFNSANKGGAFYLGENTVFKMLRDDPLNNDFTVCWSNRCSVLTNNSAENLGGAIFSENGSNIEIGQSYITDNRATFGTFLAIDSTDSETDVNLFHNFIYHNGRDGLGGFSDQSVFNISNNSSSTLFNFTDVTIKLNTIVDNHVTNSVFSLLGTNNNLKVYSSILHDPSSPMIGNLTGTGSTALFDCVNTNETTSISSGYAVLTRENIDDPGFNIRNYDYHLALGSQMVDFCDDALTGADFTLTKDIDNEVTPVDLPGSQAVHGNWDLGADESYVGPNDPPGDIIYIDSFDWN